MSDDNLGPVGRLLSDPSKWCKGTAARDKWGYSTSLVDSTDAVQWCLIGAAAKIHGVLGPLKPLEPVRKIVGPISGFNDDPDTTHSMLMDVLRYTGV